MKVELKYLLILGITLPVLCAAQQSKSLQFKWKLTCSEESGSIANKPAVILTNTSFGKTINPVTSLQDIKYSLPKGAIFCRMEDALHSKFNFWFKVRMGCDDKYSN